MLTGTFEITSWDETPYDTADASTQVHSHRC